MVKDTATLSVTPQVGPFRQNARWRTPARDSERALT